MIFYREPLYEELFYEELFYVRASLSSVFGTHRIRLKQLGFLAFPSARIVHLTTCHLLCSHSKQHNSKALIEEGGIDDD